MSASGSFMRTVSGTMRRVQRGGDGHRWRLCIVQQTAEFVSGCGQDGSHRGVRIHQGRHAAKSVRYDPFWWAVTAGAVDGGHARLASEPAPLAVRRARPASPRPLLYNLRLIVAANESVAVRRHEPWRMLAGARAPDRNLALRDVARPDVIPRYGSATPRRRSAARLSSTNCRILGSCTVSGRAKENDRPSMIVSRLSDSTVQALVAPRLSMSRRMAVTGRDGFGSSKTVSAYHRRAVVRDWKRTLSIVTNPRNRMIQGSHAASSSRDCIFASGSRSAVGGPEIASSFMLSAALSTSVSRLPGSRVARPRNWKARTNNGLA